MVRQLHIPGTVLSTLPQSWTLTQWTPIASPSSEHISTTTVHTSPVNHPHAFLFVYFYISSSRWSLKMGVIIPGPLARKLR